VFVFSPLACHLLSATQALAAVFDSPDVVNVRPVTVFAAPQYVIPLGFEAR
jgi:hypothetical protein